VRVCSFEAEGEPDGRNGIIRGQGLHADNFTVTSGIWRWNLCRPNRVSFEEGSSAQMCELFRERSRSQEIRSHGFLRSPSATRQSPRHARPPASKIHAESQYVQEIHGFAPSPRDEFAIIVCNLYLKDQCRMCRIGTRNRQFIKQNLSMLVNAFYRCRFPFPRAPLNFGNGAS
jgi:hypothetical protein